MQEFFHMHQEENQSVISFYENVIRKYRKSRHFITEQQVITVLQNDVKKSLKEHLIRNQKEIKKPEQWLQFAREEEYTGSSFSRALIWYIALFDITYTLSSRGGRNGYVTPCIQKRIQQKINVPHHESKNSPFFERTLPTATIQPTSTNIHLSSQQPFTSRYYYKQSTSTNNRTYPTQNNYTNFKHNQKNHPKKEAQRLTPCLICNKTNHPTIKCFYKKDNGCFKCGQSNHQIRDYPQQHFFE
ncbi:unnamed protein product [Rotaria sordida]|uniref:CCHC-type domain-containing protein n=1 Tax=Rotaria sordida TaxID=392033 RepID=A0A816DAM5_9BILA|nr:unnamed protein product [Rotaria sordida]CAF1634843.1 unnamed protein product [Rotaria sordida]